MQILLLERDRRVEQHHHDLGEADRAQRVGDRELFELVLDAGAAAQARGVEQLELAARATSSRERWSRG